MTSVNSIGAATTAEASKRGMASLGINDFITLMTTQLRYQDPTKPQDSSAFVAQLAQFSSVSGIQEMNSSVTSLLNEMRASQAVNATTLVGHDVLVGANAMPITSGQSVSGAVIAPDGASSINVTVTDNSGQIVRQLTVPMNADSRLASFTWDGLDDSGAQAASGTYKFKAIANVSGNSVSADTVLKTKVSSVTIDPSNNSLLLNTSGLGAITLSDVLQIT